MADADYYQLDSFPNADPTEGSDLYSGSGYNNHPVYQSEPSRPNMDIVHSYANSYNSDEDYRRPTEPSRPDLYTVHSDSNSYNSPPQELMSGIQQDLLPPLARNVWNARPAHQTHPSMKPLVQSFHGVVPQPLKIQIPNSRLRQRKYQTLKRYLRIGKIISKVITVLFSAIMFAIMLFMVIKYQTSNGEVRGGRTAWPKQPRLWPTAMLLIGAGFTLLLSCITLLSYCCAFTKARRSWNFTVVKYVVHIGAWLTISTLYRYEKSTHGVNNDLWGWSCSTKAAALQSEFNGVVNFSSLCSVQVRHEALASWKDQISANENVVQIVEYFDSGGRV